MINRVKSRTLRSPRERDSVSENLLESNLRRIANDFKVIYEIGNGETKSVMRDLRCRTQTVSPHSRGTDELLRVH